MNENYYVVTGIFMGAADGCLTKATGEEEAINKVKGRCKLNIEWKARLLDDYYIESIKLGDRYVVLR